MDVGVSDQLASEPEGQEDDARPIEDLGQGLATSDVGEAVPSSVETVTTSILKEGVFEGLA